MSATSLPAHGRITCSRCFAGETVWNVSQRQTADGWHIVNNPMSWGSRTPKYLVLGVSKGTTQCNALNTKPHNQVPFDGFRPKLTEALRVIGLMRADETIDEKIDADEKDWAFGSMVRCALGIVDSQDGHISRSGTVVQRLARMNPSSSWLAECSSAFLSYMPEQLSVCVLLSNDDGYIAACQAAITRLRPGTRRINSVAYGDEQVTWIHIVHVGGPGKNHIKDWFAGDGIQGRKRIDAQQAVSKTRGDCLSQPTLERTALSPAQVPEKFSPSTSDINSPVTARGPGGPVPKNVIRDVIIARIMTRADVEPHPDQAQLHGTKYISAFRAKCGKTFAIDKMSASKQPIWLLDSPRLRSDLHDFGIAYELYPPERGRNSNLHKLPGFKNGALLRAYPQTVEEALRVVEALCERLS